MPEPAAKKLELKVIRVTRTVFASSNGGPAPSSVGNTGSGTSDKCSKSRQLRFDTDRMAEQRDRQFAAEIRRAIHRVDAELGTGETIAGVLQATPAVLEQSRLPVG